MNELFDTLIIGSGAAAYGAALYAGRYMLRTAVISDPSHFGGDTAQASIIENYPGHLSIDGLELMNKFRAQSKAVGVETIDDPMKKIDREGDRFVVSLASGKQLKSHSLILAMGRTRRHLGLEHEEELVGKGVAYCATCDAPLFKDRIVAIAGGGDSAAKGALMCANYATKVYLIFRAPKLIRPEPINIKRVSENSKIQLLPETNVTKLNADQFLKSIEIDHPYEGSNELKVDGLFIEIGADPATQGIETLQLTLNPAGEIVRDELGTTSCPGIYAAGDIADTPLKQTITAVSSGVLAATGVHGWLLERDPLS